MDTEEVWGLWQVMSNFITKKEQEQAIEEFLQYLYEVDGCDFNDLRDMAEYEEETLFLKIIKRFIKENGLNEEDY